MSLPKQVKGSAWFLFGAILLLSFNLRSAVTSLGAVLEEIRAELHLSAALAGVLTTLPVLCFAAVGAAAPGWARRFGTRPVIVVSLLSTITGLIVRALSGNALLFMAATVLTLAGMATVNVLLPAVVKARFPQRVGLLTAAYTTMLSIGATVPAATTVPISEAFGSWRYGLATWALTAVVALFPWLLLCYSGGERPAPAGAADAPRRVTARDLARSKLAWSLALFFGLQSLQAYAGFGWLAQIFRDAGLDPVHAGLLLSILPIAGVPVSLAIPAIATRLPDQRPAVIGCGIAYVLGYTGLLTVPTTLPWLWVLLMGLGGGAFPLALTMIGLRSRTVEVTVGLSGFVQGIGYLIGAAGPLMLGILYGATGGWTLPIWILLLLMVPQVLVGLHAGRSLFVDDELSRPDQPTPR
jgi:CP family cyanate transporter-like MFS transporter